MRWKKPLLSLAVLAGGLVVAELGLRGWLALEGRPFSRQSAVAAIGGIESFAANHAEVERRLDGRIHRYPGKDKLHPFFAFDAVESKDIPLHHARLQKENPDDFRVLILGGSVAARFGREGAPRLVELLEADPRLDGRSVEILPYGHASYKQPQQLTQLAYLLSLGVTPDVVLELDGFNEVAIGTNNAERGSHPTFPSHDKWLTLTIDITDEPEAVLEAHTLRALRYELLDACGESRNSPFLGSALFAHVIIKRLEDRRNELSRRADEYVEQLGVREIPPYLLGPSFEGDAMEAARTVVEHWFESSLSTQALCDSRDITYVHVLQPAMHDEGSKPLTEKELERSRIHPSWEAGVVNGYPLMREYGARLRERGIAFHDASDVFVDNEETLYLDCVHFTPRGAEILAERIAPVVLDEIGK